MTQKMTGVAWLILAQWAHLHKGTTSSLLEAGRPQQTKVQGTCYGISWEVPAPGPIVQSSSGRGGEGRVWPIKSLQRPRDDARRPERRDEGGHEDSVSTKSCREEVTVVRIPTDSQNAEANEIVPDGVAEKWVKLPNDKWTTRHLGKEMIS